MIYMGVFDYAIPLNYSSKFRIPLTPKIGPFRRLCDLEVTNSALEMASIRYSANKISVHSAIPLTGTPPYIVVSNLTDQKTFLNLPHHQQQAIVYC